MEKKTVTMNLPVAVIDAHCHGRDMEQAHKTTLQQTIFEAKQAKIGVSIFMPNTSPAITNIETLERYLLLMYRACKIFGIRRKQYLYFGLTNHNLAECDMALKYPQVVGLKDYPLSKTGQTVTTGAVGVSDSGVRFKAMQLVRKHRKVYARHCDNPEIIAAEGNSINAELTDVADTILIAEKVPGVKIVICHVSCRESAEAILKAQNKGLEIAIELAPHYLWFDAECTNWRAGLGSVFYYCFNNLRSAKDREYLIGLLKTDNPLIIIGSDNAPHMCEEKIASVINQKMIGGLPSNQEMIAVICTLAHKHKIPEKRVAELLSWNAADYFRIEVSRKLVKTKLEEQIDTITYNNGAVENPWNGSKLLFPVKKEEAK